MMGILWFVFGVMAIQIIALAPHKKKRIVGAATTLLWALIMLAAYAIRLALT